MAKSEIVWDLEERKYYIGSIKKRFAWMIFLLIISIFSAVIAGTVIVFSQPTAIAFIAIGSLSSLFGAILFLSVIYSVIRFLELDVNNNSEKKLII